MVRKKDLENEVNGYLAALEKMNFSFQKAVLFGSVVRGDIHAFSDIDLAVWCKDFKGNYYELVEKLAPLKRLYKNIKMHLFHPDDNAMNNLFIKQIQNTGITILPGKPFSFESVEVFRKERRV